MKALLTSFLICMATIAFAEGDWAKKADFPSSSRNFGLGFSIGKKGYFGMGQKQTKPFIYKSYNDFWEYDPETDVWTQKADFPGGGRLMARGFSVNNKIYVGFGFVIAAYGSNAGGNDYQTDFYEFDPHSNKWAEKNEARLGRGDIFFVLKDKAYAVNLEYRSLNIYNAQTDTWFANTWGKKELAPNPADLAGYDVCFPSGEKEYLITTIREKGETINQLWEFDPAAISWKKKNSLPIPGSDTVSVFSIGEKNFAIMGGTEVLEYDPETQNWNTKKGIAAEHEGFRPAFYSEKSVYGFRKYEFWEFEP